MQDPAWEQELERRIRIYEQMEAAGNWPGRLTSLDYLAMAALMLWAFGAGSASGVDSTFGLTPRGGADLPDLDAAATWQYGTRIGAEEAMIDICSPFDEEQ